MTAALLAPTRHQPAWMASGACVGEWAVMDAEDPAGVAAAKAVCRDRCPVVGECLAHALATRERWGVRGGLDPTERARLAAREGRLRPSIRGTAHNRSSYAAGCRCGDCRADNAAYMQTWRRDRRVTPALTLIVHELTVPTGRGRTRAWAGQTFIEIGVA